MPNPAADDEIDLSQLWAALLRRRLWVIAFGLLGLGATAAATALTEPVWQGEFQIVMAATKDPGGILNSLASNPLLSQMGGIGGLPDGNSELETQVKILESPLVLRPVFEKVRSHKAAQGEDVSELSFSDWVQDNLEIKLEKGTSVLGIAYRDTDKRLVLQVLQQISAAYQDFSNRDRSRSLRNALSYASQQVNQLRTKAAAANRARDAFAIRYGISSGGGSISNAAINASTLLNAGLDYESSAIKNAIGNASGNSNSRIDSQGEPLGQLAAINLELIRRQQQFTDRDPSIRALKRDRDALRRYIETTAGGSLGLPEGQFTSQQQAQDVMLKYQELDRSAKRETSTLDSLENSLLNLQLEQARSSQPWELISTATLLDKPVAPRPARNLALGLLAGLVLGSGGALVADRRSGRVYSLDELQQLLPYTLLATLKPGEPSSMVLLAQGPLAGALQVALVPAGDIANIANADTIAQQLQQALQSSNPAAQVLLTADLAVAARCTAQLLLAAPGAASRDQLAQLQQNLQLQGRPVTGLLLVADAV